MNELAGRIDTEDPFQREDVESALGRIVDSPEFLKNRNSVQFLKFIVAETLEGRGERLKAYSIATMALDRGPDFDPQSNSIVRVQATRLRQLLQNYYAGPGADDPLRILLPLGSYQPLFEPAGKADDAPPETSGAPPAGTTAGAPPRTPPAAPRRVFRAGAAATVAALAAITVALALAVLWLALRGADPGPDPRLRPVVTIKAAGPATPELASATQFLQQALTHKVLAFAAGDVRGKENDLRLRAIGYELSFLSRRRAPGRADFSFQLVHNDSHDIVYARSFPDIDISDADALGALAARVASRVAEDYGALLADFRRRTALYAGPIEGQMCYLASLDYFRVMTPDRRRSAIDCLNGEIASGKATSWPSAHMAILLTRGYLVGVPGSDGAADLARAVQLAQNASEINPLSGRVQFAKFLSAFYDRRYSDAFAAGERARELNPDFSTLNAYLGATYIARGEYARGASLMKQNDPIAQLLPYLAIEALMRDDNETLLLLARTPGFADLPLGLVMRMVASNRNRNPDEAREAVEALRRKFPGAADIPAFLDRSGFTDEIEARILAALRSGADR